MQHILYIDGSRDSGIARIDELARSLGNDITLQFLGRPAAPASITPAQQWDLLVADIRSLAAPQQVFLEQVVQSNPDAVLVLITESLDELAAEALLRHGAIDCLTWRRGAGRLAKTIRRTLTRLAMTRRAIRSMDSCVEELDVTLTIEHSPKCANSLARYALRHIARMDVCGLPGQFRAIRAFEEVLENLLPNQVRMHLSQDGLRFTLRSDKVLPRQYQDGKSAEEDGFAAANHLWFTPLLMDEISVDEDREEFTMLKLPDDVCSEVAQAIARRRNTGERNHDVLGDALKVVEVRDRTDRG